MYPELHTSQVHFSVVKWAKSDVALRKESQEPFLGGKGETYGRQSH